MSLPVKTFQQGLDEMVLTWATALNISPVLKSGDPLLAIFQAFEGQVQFLQGLAQVIDSLNRAATSTGSDLDSWMADYGLVRAPATYATGTVTFSALSAHSYAVSIPVGAIIQVMGGSIQYQVLADTTQPGYNSASGSYILAAGQLSVNATVQAQAAGSISNVQPGQLSQLQTPLPGIDTVTNTTAITNGADAEGDTAFRSRFVVYLSTLARGTKAAILAAVSAVQAGLYVNLLENQRPDLTAQLGFFTALVDDGTGNPPSSLLTSCTQAIDAVRAFTVQFTVVAPAVITTTIVLDVSIDPTYTTAAVQALVQAAVIAEVNSHQIAATLYISDIETAAMTVAGVLAVKPATTTINGAQADLSVAINEVLRTDTTHVTVGTY